MAAMMTRTARNGLATAVKHAAGLVDRVAPPSPGAVILLYHRVGTGAGLELDIPADAFDRQMAMIAESGRAAHLDQAVEALAAGAPLSVHPAVVTFDDGTADVVDHALPILVRHRVPATVYVATDFVEQQRPFPYDGPPLTWTALAEAVSTGLVTVGSHTHTHAVMDKLDDRAADDELRRSRDLIEDRLGVAAEHFAYPKGVATPAAEVAVRRRYRTAALADMGVNRYGATDRYRLARSPIQRGDGMRWFSAKLAGGLALEGRLRARMNRRRYAAASN
jgi:peptidoglycan/xylan/chitin deacetylase (PgdA/CDA1 family)